jgi:SAM-dependent methyltransferase
MFVLSRAHALELLQPGVEEARAVLQARSEPAAAAHTALPPPDGRLRMLDVGAGDGEVTSRMAPLFNEVHATEVSPFMVDRLRARGYDAKRSAFISSEALPASGVYDVVAFMNLLDRCDHPADMLRDAARLLRPGTGRLLVAIVLPFSEFVEEGTRKRAVNGPLPMRGARCGDGASFEASLSALLTRVIAPLGFHVERIARVPYLCRGDLSRPYYVLSDAVLVLRPERGGEMPPPLWHMPGAQAVTGGSASAGAVARAGGAAGGEHARVLGDAGWQSAADSRALDADVVDLAVPPATAILVRGGVGPGGAGGDGGFR